MIPFLSLKSTFAPFNLRLHLVAIEKTFPAQRKQTYCFFSHFLFLPFSLCFLPVPFALHLPFLLFVHGHVSSTVCPHFLFNHRRLTKTNLVGLCIEMDVSTHRSAIGRGQKWNKIILSVLFEYSYIRLYYTAKSYFTFWRKEDLYKGFISSLPFF